jgi:hypothetical protein
MGLFIKSPLSKLQIPTEGNSVAALTPLSSQLNSNSENILRVKGKILFTVALL